MALRQDTVRLLIADDVGVGKTIEALLIARELLDRGRIERLAVICPPHLCEQWREELFGKFGIDAEIIRSDTAAQLDRRIQGDASVFRFYPYQVISIDYIKSDQRFSTFIAECPELVIVDEAHTCARPAGANQNQHLRHRLVKGIANRQRQHLILLTATPHSGIENSFYSLLGLLDPQFESLKLSDATQAERQRVARHFIQRRRGDVRRWLNEETPFPERDSKEVEYEHGVDYMELFNQIVTFVQGYVRGASGPENQRRFRYWTVLGLLRGVMSSPRAGAMMLRRQAARRGAESDMSPEDATALLFDVDASQSDAEPLTTSDSDLSRSSEGKMLVEFANRLQELGTIEMDAKGRAAAMQVLDWVKAGISPIVFCRFIETARYLESLIAPLLAERFPGIPIAAVTGEMNDDQRRDRIGELAEGGDSRVLIATDCLSEGINLQEHFTAVLHYDLPWNPNRIEQREGRIDRFGQTAPTVMTHMLIGRNNTIDGAVLRVLLRKAKEIRNDTGVAVAFPEDSQSILDAVLHAILFSAPDGEQLALGLEIIAKKESDVSRAMETALGKERESQSLFAQSAIDPTEIERDLQETDQALGDPAAVAAFTVKAVRFLGGVIEPRRRKDCYMLSSEGLPESATRALPSPSKIPITFTSPVAEGHLYIGRNHPFVEALCGHLFRSGFTHDGDARPARAAVVRTASVRKRTTLLLLRIRTVIREQAANSNDIVAEEVLTWGFVGDPGDRAWLSDAETQELLRQAVPSDDMSREERGEFLHMSQADIDGMGEVFKELTRERTERLVASHERYSASVGGNGFAGIEPILPPDVLGVYVLLPSRS